VAGDFNATYDVQPFRRLLRNGYRDAAEQGGSGFTPTYPANATPPPLIAIDHILTRRCTATSTDVVPLPGSDHRGLVSSIAVPLTPSG
jgi:endonuclease/exonuclease/phosphatase (EEP) superfamily protein YafD